MNELSNYVLKLLNDSSKKMSKEDYIKMLESLSLVLKVRAEMARNAIIDAYTYAPEDVLEDKE